jgi:predicted nucleic acid-binding Zn ribbon protein
VHRKGILVLLRDILVFLANLLGIREAQGRSTISKVSPPPAPTLSCVVCGSTFTAKRADAKTCSARCRQRLSRGRLERKHPKYARAWPDRQPVERHYYDQPPEELVSGEIVGRDLEIALFDLALEIGNRFDKKTGRFEWRRWRRAYRLYKDYLQQIEAYCAGNGADLNLVREMVRVERAIRTTVSEVKEHMDTQAVIEANRQEHEKTRAEIINALNVKLEGETPGDAAERILAENDPDGKDSA